MFFPVSTLAFTALAVKKVTHIKYDYHHYFTVIPITENSYSDHFTLDCSYCR